MKPKLKRDLADLSEIMEDLVKDFPSMTREDKIDVCARLKPAAKHIEALDKEMKEIIKKRLGHKEGTVLGDIFKAVLKLVPIDRLDQKALKEGDPDTYDVYVKKNTDERITFEPR